MPNMPRKEKPQTPDVMPAIARIRGHIDEENISINQLAKLADVGQPALARFVQGERKTVTYTARKVLRHINNRHKTHNRHAAATAVRMSGKSRPASMSLVEEAIRANWPLNTQSIQLLAAMVAAVAPVLEISADQSHKT